MPGYYHSDQAVPDLPFVPTSISAEDFGTLAHYLRGRDAREPLTGLVLQVALPPGAAEDDDDNVVTSFELGGADPEREAPGFDEGGGMIAKSGEVLTASGHRLFAVVILDRDDAYEHWDTLFFFPVPADRVPGHRVSGHPEESSFKTIAQSAEDLELGLSSLKKKTQYEDLRLFPFTYRYFDDSKRRQDPHVDQDTGWSFGGREVVEEVLAACWPQAPPYT